MCAQWSESHLSHHHPHVSLFPTYGNNDKMWRLTEPMLGCMMWLWLKIKKYKCWARKILLSWRKLLQCRHIFGKMQHTSHDHIFLINLTDPHEWKLVSGVMTLSLIERSAFAWNTEKQFQKKNNIPIAQLKKLNLVYNLVLATRNIHDFSSMLPQLTTCS